MTADPKELLAGLVLEDGASWGSLATDWQWADALAVLDHDPDAARLHFLTRPRGGSKTTDLAAVTLVALLCQAPPMTTSHAYARDRDQAALLIDALRGLAHRSGLSTLLDLGAWSATVKHTGAKLVVESADAASAHGHLPFLIVVDELAQWPATRGARGLWEALVSGLPKRRDSRLAVISTAGDPTHWSRKILDAALASDRWRVSQIPGPLSWADPADLAEQKSLLPSSVYARLHMNIWSAAEDRLVDTADLAACVTLDGPLDYDPSRRYVIGLDLGLKHDRTVLTICHAETPATGGPPTVVLDRIVVMAGTRDRPVQLGDVETAAIEAARAYGAPIRLDPWQAIGLAQRLRARGIVVEEWTFSGVSVGRLAMVLHLLLRERRFALPDDADLLHELASVRLRETTPGVFRLDHDSGQHDDRAVALGLAALALTERAPAGRGGVTVPGGRVPTRLAGASTRTSLPKSVQVAAAAKRSPRGIRAILGVKGAHYDTTRRGHAWDR